MSFSWSEKGTEWIWTPIEERAPIRSKVFFVRFPWRIFDREEWFHSSWYSQPWVVEQLHSSLTLKMLHWTYHSPFISGILARNHRSPPAQEEYLPGSRGSQRKLEFSSSHPSRAFECSLARLVKKWNKYFWEQMSKKTGSWGDRRWEKIGYYRLLLSLE